MELEGALGILEAFSAERNRPERVSTAPGHTAQKRRMPQHLSLRLGARDSPVPKMSSSVTGLPQMYPLGPRFMLKLGLCYLQASSWAQRWATLSL